MTTTLAPVDDRTLVNGKKIKARWLQMLIWSFIIGFFFAAFVAGAYYGGLQVDWHVHIGAINFTILNAKAWWDAGSFWPHWLGHWVTYRHAAFRNLLEPEIAIMGVMTVMARPKWWDYRASRLRMITSPFILVVAAVVLNVIGVWLLNFAWPGAPWNSGVLEKYSVATLILGFAIGRLLHIFWAPVGATLQGDVLDWAACRAHEKGRVPLWVYLPVPPVLRERFSKLWRDPSTIRVVGAAHKWLIVGIAVVVTLVASLGVAGHYWVGVLGKTIPYLAPR